MNARWGESIVILLFAIISINIFSGFGFAATICTTDSDCSTAGVGGYELECVDSDNGGLGASYKSPLITPYACRAGMVAGQPDVKICIPIGDAAKGTKQLVQNCECHCSGAKCITCGPCESCQNGQCKKTCHDIKESCGCSKTSSGCKLCASTRLAPKGQTKIKCWTDNSYCSKYEKFQYEVLDTAKPCVNNECSYIKGTQTDYKGDGKVTYDSDGLWKCTSSWQTCSGKCCGCSETDISASSSKCSTSIGLIMAGQCMKCTGAGTKACESICKGTSADCGCEICTNCDNIEKTGTGESDSAGGWFIKGSATSTCISSSGLPGSTGLKYCPYYQYQEKRDYICSKTLAGACKYNVIGNKDGCTQGQKSCPDGCGDLGGGRRGCIDNACTCGTSSTCGTGANGCAVGTYKCICSGLSNYKCIQDPTCGASDPCKYVACGDGYCDTSEKSGGLCYCAADQAACASGTTNNQLCADKCATGIGRCSSTSLSGWIPTGTGSSYGCASDQICYCSPSACTDDCATSGLKQCTSAGPTGQYKVCGNYDSDPCMEWSGTQSCSVGQACSGGKCTTASGSNICTAGECSCTSKLVCSCTSSGSCYWAKLTDSLFTTNCVITGKCPSSGSNSCFDSGGTCIGLAPCINLGGTYNDFRKYSDCSETQVCCYPGSSSSGTPNTAQSCNNVNGDCVMYERTCATRGGQIIGSCKDSSTSPYCCSVKPASGTPGGGACTKNSECASSCNSPIPGAASPTCINGKCGCCIGAGCNSDSNPGNKNPGGGIACRSACQNAGYSAAACCTNDDCEGYTYIESEAGNEDCAALYPNESPFCVCKGATSEGGLIMPYDSITLKHEDTWWKIHTESASSVIYLEVDRETEDVLEQYPQNCADGLHGDYIETCNDEIVSHPTTVNRGCSRFGQCPQYDTTSYLMTKAPIEYSDSECDQGMLIATNLQGMPIKEGVLISDIADKSTIFELETTGKIKLTEICFSPLNVTQQEFTVVEKDAMACQSSCKVNETCECNIINCGAGIVIIKNIQGRPVNVLQTSYIQFLESLQESVEFIPQSEGAVQVTAICFSGGKVKTTKTITITKS